MDANEEQLKACLAKMQPDVHDAFLTVLSYLVGQPVKLSTSQIVTLVNSEIEARQYEQLLARRQLEKGK